MKQRSGMYLVMAALLWTAAAAAQAQVVVVAGKSAGDLGKEQVADIFLGKSTSMTPIDQPESSPLREEFYSKVTGKSAAQAKSLWAKLAFTGKGSPPKEAANSAEVKKMVAGAPGTVGYIEKSAVDDTVKVIYGAH